MGSQKDLSKCIGYAGELWVVWVKNYVRQWNCPKMVK
ncbi:hypothetical protein ES705_33205 [subsurface metagenome]